MLYSFNMASAKSQSENLLHIAKHMKITREEDAQLQLENDVDTIF